VAAAAAAAWVLLRLSLAGVTAYQQLGPCRSLTILGLVGSWGRSVTSLSKGWSGREHVTRMG
jgi:hypothetical protein